MRREASSIRVIPPSTDVARVQLLAQAESATLLPNDTVLVTGCGTVDEQKGPDLWLDVARAVLSSTNSKRVFFAWIGEGPWLERLREQARRMGLGGRVLFLGSQENPYPMLSRSVIFTMTSRSDSFPVVVLEAMALGVPVVAFRSGGVAEEVGDSGILCRPGDVNEMAAHVLRLLRNPARRHAMSSRALERVSVSFDMPRFRTQMEDLIGEILSTTGEWSASWYGDRSYQPRRLGS
jgi:glycosyltransferase involved in cell wall biosynthesis